MLAISSAALFGFGVVGGVVLVTRSLNNRSARPESSATSAPSPTKSRSGIRHSLGQTLARFQRSETGVDCTPCIHTTRQAAPARTNHAGQRITLVDRHAIILTRAFHAVHQQRFNVRFEGIEDGVIGDQTMPRAQIE